MTEHEPQNGNFQRHKCGDILGKGNYVLEKRERIGESSDALQQGEPAGRGRIEVICGSMFSGKTEELIRRLRRAQIARQRIGLFKPSIDTRYNNSDVVSHEGRSLHATPVDASGAILVLAEGLQVVGIDEAQFFDDELPSVCNALAGRGMRVIVAGLDLDYKGVPFGPMPHLCAIADDVVKVHAICVRCGALAYISHRRVESEERVLLGEETTYEPLCRRCWQQMLNKAQP